LSIVSRPHEISDSNNIKVNRAIPIKEEIAEIKYPWDIVQLNRQAIKDDLSLIKGLRKSARVSGTNKVINPSGIFIEKGAVVEHCFLNATDGPIYIGRSAEVMEGTMIRGPVAIGDNCTVKMGTRIYGATSLGPYCIAGGEIKNSVFQGCSNKAHDGYLGDSVIGAWCNMGAGTSNSNVKNNASSVSVYTPHGPRDVGLKCGVFMGDYTRTAINTSINTGTVTGICCNIYGTGLTPKYIPSFSWGSEGINRYDFDKALVDIENWKTLKQQTLTNEERLILKYAFDNF
jgi:UDP-N-acetylglucosamine diphosphorylase/glucosamine-1-phosphate N-acetyltransferase